MSWMPEQWQSTVKLNLFEEGRVLLRHRDTLFCNNCFICQKRKILFPNVKKLKITLNKSTWFSIGVIESLTTINKFLNKCRIYNFSRNFQGWNYFTRWKSIQVYSRYVCGTYSLRVHGMCCEEDSGEGGECGGEASHRGADSREEQRSRRVQQHVAGVEPHGRRSRHSIRGPEIQKMTTKYHNLQIHLQYFILKWNMLIN